MLSVVRCPSDTLSLTNCAVVNPMDYPGTNPRQKVHIRLGPRTPHPIIFTVKLSDEVKRGCIGLSLTQRKFATASIGQEMEIHPFEFDQTKECMATVLLEVDFLQKKQTTTEPYDTDLMAADFVGQFSGQAFVVGMPLAFNFRDKKLLALMVKELETADTTPIKVGGEAKVAKANVGMLLPNTKIVFEKGEGATINLTGKSKGKVTRQNIINPNWDFQKMGIGGLDKEFNAIFRRAFASRVFPPEVVEQLGCKHVKGILLFGPPGTGKTLMARQIGKMLHSKEPKIVNGPEILDKYVGQSEANIRLLFADAEEEEKRLGVNSSLHIIIFDEIDAICKSRGSVGG